MRKPLTILFSAALVLTLAATALAQTTSEQLPGTWILAPNPRAESGTLVFNDDGTYVLEERHVADGVQVGVTGQYLVDESASPVRIDLCLEQCGGPGSEWTTRFGILRFLEDGGLEIRTSPDVNPPTEFTTEEDPYTMILTRGGKF